MVATGIFLALSRGIQEEQIVPARYSQEFLTIAGEQHDDADRALMSSNMQRQAVPLSRSKKCIVGTGLERQVALDSRVPAIAEHEGNIVYNDTHKILLFGSGNALSISLTIYQRSNKNTCKHQKSQMEVWALKGFGVAHILQEMLTYKSNHIKARQEVLGTTIIGGTIPKLVDAPESFRLLVRELRSLALELNHFLVSEKDFQIQRKEV
ncbi:hypothetical protein KIW84_044259 [Lathyrus oleraceus]|uniref:DNA-directed RNA polymerase n=1 Tax=Pisum sativum TaxID=3888 RepID=A0A9D4XK67_PEA|nr:hypothetical protein KIW84_044259 [Pisum sativum]